MKLSWLAPVVALSVFYVVCEAAEPPPPVPRTISVSGSAVGYVPADTVIWTVTLESAGKDLLEAKETSDQQVKALIDVCQKKGIQAADMDVGVIRIKDIRTAEGGSVEAARDTFSVTRIVCMRQRDLRQFTGMLETLSRGRGLRVRYDIVSSKTDQVTRDTLVKATHVAKDKATAMVAVLGARLGNVLSISEYPSAAEKMPAEGVMVDLSSAAFGADAEKLTITVYVTFEVQ